VHSVAVVASRIILQYDTVADLETQLALTAGFASQTSQNVVTRCGRWRTARLADCIWSARGVEVLRPWPAGWATWTVATVITVARIANCMAHIQAGQADCRSLVLLYSTARWL
jgi:hypothetical protein